MAKVIKVENLSKAYQLGDFGTGTISRDIERFWARLRGKEDPFLKIGEVNDRTKKGEGDIVWSLNDLNFEVEQGDAVGIIGRNGAGKSTLLKILSRVTSPTSGSVKIKGRIASLLEVGTGFHPELSGKENIFLNGAILGMRKAEIKRKFDEIVDFAGVERYIDTPVKRYSSGMYVRLAFAVAAHLESEILIVDEVLAVGDAEFQKKCVGKMGDVSRSEGRTILFVSHNMDSVRSLCNKGLVLNNGQIIFNGDVNEAVQTYSIKRFKASNTSIENVPLNGSTMIQLFQIDNLPAITHKDLDFTLIINSTEINTTSSLVLLILDEYEQRLAVADLRNSDLFRISSTKYTYEIKGKLRHLPFLPGIYQFGIYIQSHSVSGNFYNLLQFEVLQKRQEEGILPYDLSVRGKIEIDHTFSIK
jgi:lipopolysaccharide transport system ATP-binding protein